jgi:hypothetical protein
MSTSLSDYRKRPVRQLHRLVGSITDTLREQNEVLSSLQDKATEILLKPSTAASDTLKFADMVVSKFEWLEKERVTIKLLVDKCKTQSDEPYDAESAALFQKRVEEAYQAYYHLKLARQRGLSLNSIAFKAFFEKYVEMIQALYDCSAIATKLV